MAVSSAVLLRIQTQSSEIEGVDSIFLERFQSSASSSDHDENNSKLPSYHHLPTHGDEELDISQLQEWRSRCNATFSADIPDAKELSAVEQVVHMCSSMTRVHGMGFVGISCSFVICWATGLLRVSLLDVSFFKSMGLLLSVMLSLRVRNAVTRRTDLVNQMLRMINTAKTVLDMAGASSLENRRILSQALGVCFADVALWLTRHCAEEYSKSISVTKDWLRDQLSRLPNPYKRNFLRFGGITTGVSPRPQLLYLREVCDTLFIPEATQNGAIIKTSNVRRWHKNIDRELQRLVDLFDDLCLYDEEVHTKQFRWLISALIFSYVALYPWFVADERKLILAMTTCLMAVVFYGLDAMAQELEEPLGPHSQGLDIPRRVRQAFADLEKEAQVRKNFDQELDKFGEVKRFLDSRAGFTNEQIYQQGERANPAVGYSAMQEMV